MAKAAGDSPTGKGPCRPPEKNRDRGRPLMALIGIIANPSSGKDIRRLVAEAAGSDNRLKVNIVRRVLLGIAAVGVGEVVLMPDRFGIGRQALDGLNLPF